MAKFLICVALVLAVIWFIAMPTQPDAAERSIPTAGKMANPVTGKYW